MVFCNIISAYYYLQMTANHNRKEEVPLLNLGNVLFQTIFLIDMIVNFLLERLVDNPEHIVVERQVSKIALIYIKSDFLFDLLTILPLWEACYKKFSHYEYFLLIRTLRIKNGIQAINANMYIDTLREIIYDRVDKMIKKGHKAAEDKNKNYTFISQLVVLLHVLKIIECFIVLVSISYFIGELWYILLLLQNEYLEGLNGVGAETFLTKFGIDSDDDNIHIKLTYFAVTTLSTIGLGDLHPRSNFERLLCSLIFICGVAMFSIILNNINKAVNSL